MGRYFREPTVAAAASVVLAFGNRRFGVANGISPPEKAVDVKYEPRGRLAAIELALLLLWPSKP